ncbi:MAG TPA: NADH-quinone oxidoreductase subunit J [Dongiaceae bacterium]|nr:NADH-quinone oxidoreductase subunit J [Dongiaceae bacterium]
MLDSVLFYFFAGVAVIGAALVVTSRNAIHSAVFLITTLLATAGIFLQLRAEFLFIAQIILYVGGIMVLFIFVIMLVRLDVPLHHLRFRMKNLVVTVVIAVLGAEAGAIIYLARKLPGQGLFIQNMAPPDKLASNSEKLAESLFSGYLLPFEIASVLLLVAMVGAVVMAKNKKRTEEES